MTRAKKEPGAGDAGLRENVGSNSDRYLAPIAGGFNLVLYDAARRALAEAHRIDEVKEVHDKAAAVQEYARRARDTELVTKATEIRMHAERRAGELLREMTQRNERRGHSQRSRGETSEVLPPKLSDLGISKAQSSRWRRWRRSTRTSSRPRSRAPANARMTR